MEHHGFSDGGQKPAICTRDNVNQTRRGKKAGFAHVNLLSCAKWAVLHTWVGAALIIVDFDVVIIDTLVGFDVSHRQTGSRGGRGRPTASGSGRCLPDTSSRGCEDAGDGRRAERSEAE